jgi:hypothetical protein
MGHPGEGAVISCDRVLAWVAEIGWRSRSLEVTSRN